MLVASPGSGQLLMPLPHHLCLQPPVCGLLCRLLCRFLCCIVCYLVAPLSRGVRRFGACALCWALLCIPNHHNAGI